LVSPKNNFDQLISIAKISKDQTSFRSTIGYLKIFPNNGYVLVIYSGDEELFNPAEFIIVYKKDGHFELELINGPGQNINFLYGNDATEYLIQHQIDLAKLDEVFKKQYCY